jgi:hypothetical protein
MADDPKYIKDFKALSRSEPLTEEDNAAVEQEAYVRGNDRATVVMFGSYVERSLSGVLLHAMRQDLNADARKRLLEYEGSLGSFSAKIITAYAFKLIGPTCLHDLDLVRLLRNGFAHSRMHFNFTTPQVREICRHLLLIERPDSFLPLSSMGAISDDDLKEAADKSQPRTRFVATCHELVHRMTVARRYPQPGDPVYIYDEPLP